MAVRQDGSVGGSDEIGSSEFVVNKPRQDVLRGNESCDSLLEGLDKLDVTGCDLLIKIRAGENVEVFNKNLAFTKGTKVSMAHLLAFQEFAGSLGALIADAVERSLAGTPGAGHDLLIEAHVKVSGRHGPRSISAWVTAIAAVDSDFDNRRLWLL